MSKGKAWYKSKTAWFNIICFALCILSGDINLMTKAGLIAAINYALRIWFTNEPIVRGTAGTIRKSGLLS